MAVQSAKLFVADKLWHCLLIIIKHCIYTAVNKRRRNMPESTVDDFLGALRQRDARASQLARTLPTTALHCHLPNGQSVLGTACMHRNIPAINELVARGARTDTKDKLGYYPCDWLLGILSAEKPSKACFASGYHCRSDKAHAHDDAVLMGAFEALLKSRQVPGASTPRLRMKNFVHPDKTYYKLLRPFACQCDASCCTCKLKKHVTKVLDLHQASDNDIGLLADVFTDVM
jgi:hypothetical protein